MQNSNMGLIVLAVVVLIIAIYFINQNKNSQKLADAAIVASSPPPPCVPFTKAQRDEQKKELNKICAKKQLIPVIGVFQFTACLAKVDAQLTPVKTC